MYVFLKYAAAPQSRVLRFIPRLYQQHLVLKRTPNGKGGPIGYVLRFSSFLYYAIHQDLRVSSEIRIECLFGVKSKSQGKGKLNFMG